MPSGPRPSPPSRTAKVVFNLQYGSVPMANVMWLFLSGSGEITHADLLSLAGSVGAKYGTRFMPWLRSELLLSSCQIVLYTDPEPIDALAAIGTAGSHTTSTHLPANVAACVSWKVAAHYRGGHARTYLPGISYDQLADIRTFTGGTQTALTNAAIAFHADVEGITPPGSGITSIQHGIVSFVHAKAWRTPPIFRRISDASVDARIDSQRRRLGRDVT